ncbi:MAG TPA: hypothetical protein VFA93_00235 [Patescibacteria group bacterium]|nr:hypothetical protein [Patescibacteria group bacterium]
MLFDTNKLLTIAVEGGSLISVFAAVIAGLVMAQVTKKFGTGILASGFKSISIGVLFIAMGILIDAVESYIQVSGGFEISTIIVLVKEAFFVIGTYIIVIGSKKTGDKLESLTK